MDLAEIQYAIEELPREQQGTLAAWLAEREQEAWDAELERDFAHGAPALFEGDEGRRPRRQVPAV